MAISYFKIKNNVKDETTKLRPQKDDKVEKLGEWNEENEVWELAFCETVLDSCECTTWIWTEKEIYQVIIYQNKATWLDSQRPSRLAVNISQHYEWHIGADNVQPIILQEQYEDSYEVRIYYDYNSWKVRRLSPLISLNPDSHQTSFLGFCTRQVSLTHFFYFKFTVVICHSVLDFYQKSNTV